MPETLPSSDSSSDLANALATGPLMIEPAAGALGAYVRGVDLRQSQSSASIAALRAALDDHLVVFLPDQDLTLDQLERLTDELGGRDVTPFVKGLDERPMVIRVVKEANDELNFANAWHTDLSYLDAPPSYTVLHGSDIPSHGGDTLWSNQYLAFSTLSAGLRSTLLSLSAIHSAGLAYGTGGYLESVKSKSSMAIEPSVDAYRRNVHPVVTRHPSTGKAALYVNPVYTAGLEGWSAAESQALLSYLYRHSVNENFTCRLRWKPKMIAIWDNRCTLHNALNDYSGVRRELFRTSVKGSVPVAFSEWGDPG